MTETSPRPCPTGDPLLRFFTLTENPFLLDSLIKNLSSFSKREPPGTHGSKEVKGKTHTYYQVLIDTRDCPHIVSHELLLAKAR